MDGLDAYRSAKLLLDSKGDDALVSIRKRISEATAHGDDSMRVVWQRIATAIEVLQQTTPTPGRSAQ